MASGSTHRLFGENGETPLNVTGAGTVTGDAVQLHPNSDEFVAILNADVNVAGTSLDVTIETAHRPSGPWFTAVTFTQVVGADSDQMRNLNPGVAYLLNFVRAKAVTVGGGSDYDVVVDLHYRPTSG